MKIGTNPTKKQQKAFDEIRLQIEGLDANGGTSPVAIVAILAPHIILLQERVKKLETKDENEKGTK